MRFFCRIAGLLGFGAARRSRPAAPEVWCRPATVLALRDPQSASACLSGWR